MATRRGDVHAAFAAAHRDDDARTRVVGQAMTADKQEGYADRPVLEGRGDAGKAAEGVHKALSKGRGAGGSKVRKMLDEPGQPPIWQPKGGAGGNS